MCIHLEVLFTHDAAGDLERVNEPDGAPRRDSFSVEPPTESHVGAPVGASRPRNGSAAAVQYRLAE